MEILNSKTIVLDGFEIIYTLETDYTGAVNNFEDNWLAVGDHEGGVTVKSLDGNYYEPQNYSLSELASDYAKKGRDNPSFEAYQSLQKQLTRDINAFEVYLVVTVKRKFITLITDQVICYDYSCSDGDIFHDLLDHAEEDQSYVDQAKKIINELAA